MPTRMMAWVEDRGVLHPRSLVRDRTAGHGWCRCQGERKSTGGRDSPGPGKGQKVDFWGKKVMRKKVLTLTQLSDSLDYNKRMSIVRRWYLLKFSLHPTSQASRYTDGQRWGKPGDEVQIHLHDGTLIVHIRVMNQDTYIHLRRVYRFRLGGHE